MRLQSAALTDDAVLEMRHAAGLADPRLLELDSLRELVEQPASTSEQDVDHVDPDLVHESGREELLVEVRPISPIRFSPAASCAFARALSIPSVTVKSGSGGSSCRWVTTKHGTSPSGPLPPHASIELSYERRP
jgi:hypothetical protein